MKNIILTLVVSAVTLSLLAQNTNLEVEGDAKIEGAIKIGTTNSNEAGTIRFNSTTSNFEGYNGVEWVVLEKSDQAWVDSLSYIFRNESRVGIGTSLPDSSAVLELNSNNKGFLLPRMSTSGRNAIEAPAQGLMILNTDDYCFDTYADSTWRKNCPLAIDNKWVRKGEFPGTPRESAISFVINSKAYVGTGNSGAANFQNDFYEYDSGSDTWTQKASFPGGGRRQAVSFVIGNKGYLCTGQGSSGRQNDLWEYNPIMDMWIQKANLPAGGRVSAIGFAINGKGYVGTGLLDGNIKTNDMWKYDPLTDTWSALNDFGGPPSSSMVAVATDSKVYVGTGSNTSYTDAFWEYDPVTDIWTQKADFGGNPASEAVIYVLDGNVYLGLGLGSGASSEIWKYDSVNDSWMFDNNFLGPVRFRASAFTLKNTAYIVLGNLPGGIESKEVRAYEDRDINYSEIHDGLWERDQFFTYNLFSQIGIGTATPEAKLEVASGDILISRGSADFARTRKLRVQGARNGGGSPFATINFENFDNNNDSTNYIGATIESYNQSSEDSGNLVFNTSDTSGLMPRLAITEKGEIGINTTNPRYKFTLRDTSNALLSMDSVDVSNLTFVMQKGESTNNEAIGLGFQSSTSDANIGAAILHEKTGNGSKGKLHFATKTEDINSVDIPIHMTLSDNGNLGIKTTNPSNELEVVGTIETEDFIMSNGAADNYILSSDAVGNATWINPDTMLSDWKVKSDTLYNDIASYVGIGTELPNAKLVVSDTRDAMLGVDSVDISNLIFKIRKEENMSNEAVGIGFQNSTNRDNTGAAIIHERLGAESEGKLHFATKGNNDIGADIPIQMTLDENGNLGLGETDPASSLHIKLKNSSSGLLIENDGEGNDYWRQTISTNDFRFYYDSDGPGPNGQSSLSFVDDADGSWNMFSDRSLKKEIITLDEKIIHKVIQLKPSLYYYKHNKREDQKSLGFIAQEVQELFPEIVKTSEQGTLALNYNDFSILAIKAIQEQQDIIDTQEKELSHLHNSLNKTSNQVQMLTNELKRLMDEFQKIKESSVDKR